MLSNRIFDTLGVAIPETLSAAEVVAPELVAKLRRSREHLHEDDEAAFTDATLQRVMDLLARNRELLGSIDAAAGSDGSIGVFFEEGRARVYADFLGSGRIRVFARDARGDESRFITNEQNLVASTLAQVASRIKIHFTNVGNRYEIVIPTDFNEPLLLTQSIGASTEPQFEIRLT